MGYAGGTGKNPTYRSLGGHAETLQVDYDPARISYDTLLDVFWESHDATRKSWSSQYRSAVFFSDEGQRRAAEESRSAAEKRLGEKIFTEITPLGTFTSAEDYHQKYSLRRNSSLLAVLSEIFPSAASLRDSTLAARLNGYLAGYGTVDQALEETGEPGFTDAVRERLRRILEEGSR